MNVLLISGGNDSMYIYHKLNDRKKFKLVYIDYGQKYSKEEIRLLPSDVEILKIPGMVTDDNGYVRGRNLTFLIEIAKKYPDATIFMGSNKDDIFPDNNGRYLRAACKVINIGYNAGISVKLPLQSVKKRDIMKYIRENGIRTYSCYKGGIPCGKCKACKSVKDATL